MDDHDAQARIDAALVEQAVREGDARVFGMLVRRHQGLVRAQLRRLLGNDFATADDLAQDTFVLAWRKLHQFRGDSRFATWLYRIAHSCFLQHLRSRGGGTQTAAEPDVEESETAGADIGTPALALDLDAALQRLSANQRAALLYCVQIGLSHDEAAQVLDMPLGSVKTHVARGKAKLRQLLHDWAPDDTVSNFQ
jgi:RNA polymerase sigma factor (sigma-70 family)